MVAPLSPLLHVRNLSVAAQIDGKEAQIVRDVSFDLAKGEVLGLIGESGAGKSTVGLATMGYVRSGCTISGGEVIFAGRDLLTVSEPERRAVNANRISYVAQSAAASFNPAFRLMDQIVETVVKVGGRSRATAVEQALQLFREMRLPSPDTIGERFSHQVSGGQLQRMMIAMALMSEPDIIVFDEPTTALDVSTQRDVLISIREVIRNRGMAAIYISHDLAVVAQLADRIAVMRHGAVVEAGDTKQIMDAPQHPYTKLLWSVRKLEAPERQPGHLLLRATGLDVSYGTQRALDNVSIDIERGAMVALVGESGSGKTTLGRLLAGFLPKATGDITFEGQHLAADLKERRPDMARRIQYIYQSAETALNPRHKVRKIIARPLTFFQGMEGEVLGAKTRELLDQVNLPASLLEKYPYELSGGQRQRVAIARAIAGEPDLLICDEVTSALDQVVQVEILSLLKRLRDERGLTCLFITHDIDTVHAIADKVMVMHRGTVVEVGSRSDVLDTPEADYTRELLSAVPQMDPDWLTRQMQARPQ